MLQNIFRSKQRCRFDFYLIFHHIEGFLSPLSGSYSFKFQRGSKKQGLTEYKKIEKSPDSNYKLYFDHQELTFQTSMKFMGKKDDGVNLPVYQFKSKSVKFNLMKRKKKKKEKLVVKLKQDLRCFINKDGSEFTKTMYFPLKWPGLEGIRLLMTIRSKMRPSLDSERDEEFATETDVTSFVHLDRYESVDNLESLELNSKVQSNTDDAELDQYDIEPGELQGFIELGLKDDIQEKPKEEEIKPNQKGEVIEPPKEDPEEKTVVIESPKEDPEEKTVVVEPPKEDVEPEMVAEKENEPDKEEEDAEEEAPNEESTKTVTKTYLIDKKKSKKKKEEESPLFVEVETPKPEQLDMNIINKVNDDDDDDGDDDDVEVETPERFSLFSSNPPRRKAITESEAKESPGWQEISYTKDSSGVSRKKEKKKKKNRRKLKGNYYCYVYYYTNSKEKRVCYSNRLEQFCKKILFIGVGRSNRINVHLDSSCKGSILLNNRLYNMHQENIDNVEDVADESLPSVSTTPAVSAVQTNDKKQFRVYRIKLNCVVRKYTKYEACLRKHSLLLALTSKTKYWGDLAVKRLAGNQSYSNDNTSNLLNLNTGREFKPFIKQDLVNYGISLAKLCAAKQLLGHIDEVNIDKCELKRYYRFTRNPANYKQKWKYGFPMAEEEKRYKNHFNKTQKLDKWIVDQQIRKHYYNQRYL